jgi:menaquinone-dependent protoporphyrinogen IX oxidase
MMRILITYGTTEGQTARISEYLAEVIRDHGHEANAVDIKGSGAPEPDDYDAVTSGPPSTWANTRITSRTSSGRTATRSNVSRPPSSP